MIDLLADFPGWTVSFELMWRQEQSRHASGRTRVKDFGSPIWQASYQSRSLSPNLLDEWQARLESLENGLKTFKGYALSRCRPIKHPGSAALPSGVVATIGEDRKTVTLSGLSDITLSVGDMIQIGSGDLHRVVGVGATIEVRPHLWPGVDVADDVMISKPACVMTIVPGSVSASADPRNGRGSISFSAIEARG